MRRILANWPYKLFALGAAILLTGYVYGQRNPWVSRSVAVTLEQRNLQRDYVVTLAQDEAPVTVEGPKLDVEAVQPKAIKAWVDLAKLEEGTHTVQIKVAVLPALGRVTVTPAVSNVAVTIEAKETRTMPVEVKIKSSPPIGYAVTQPAISPAAAVISGRSSSVNRVARLVVLVDPTPLRPSSDDFEPIKALDVRGNEVIGVDVEPQGAHVALKLVEAPASKSVFVSPGYVGQPQFPFRVVQVSVTPSFVTVRGRPEVLAGTAIIATDDVDVTGAVADLVRYVTLRIPPGIEVEGSRQVKVTIRIQQPGPGP